MIMRTVAFVCLLLLGLVHGFPQDTEGTSSPSRAEGTEEVVETTTPLVATESMEDLPSLSSLLEGRSKKGKGMEQMYMMFMMCKSLISTLLMFIGPIIQVKSFGLAVIGTLINIARFVMQVKQSKEGHNSPNLWAHDEEDRIGVAYRPPPQFIKKVVYQ